MRLIETDALLANVKRNAPFVYSIIAPIVAIAPTVDAEPVRHGRWIYGITLNHEWRKCSECLVSQDIFGCFTYCPNCGAKMDGDRE